MKIKIELTKKGLIFIIMFWYFALMLVMLDISEHNKYVCENNE